MLMRLHKNARTTPAIRAELRAATEPVAVLAQRYGISEMTVRKWQAREDPLDRSHTAHRLQTTLSTAQEAIVVELRRTLLLALDDLLVVTRAFINARVSRSGLDRCLRRHGVARLEDVRPAASESDTPPSGFRPYDPGYLHVDIKYLPPMPDEPARRYLYVAIDRATRWVHLEVLDDQKAATAAGFLTRVHERAPFHVRTVLTDNAKAFTDRFCATGERDPSGTHVFDKVCRQQQIEHRLIPPRHPQTNGMVERFNGRISEVLAGTRFVSGADLHSTLTRYLWLYNDRIPQKALGHVTPIEALKQWQKNRPELFRKQVRNQPGPDSY